MARRKRAVLDDDLDSSEGSDVGSDDEDNSGGFRPEVKRRKRDNTLYGSFADESDEEDVGKRRRRQDITKAPQFIAGYKLDFDKTIEIDEGEGENTDESVEDGESVAEEDSSEQPSDVEQERPPSPRVREESPEPVRGFGLGMRNAEVAFQSFASTSQINELPEKKTSRGGIGSNAGSNMPTSFGKTKGQARTFVREDKPPPFKPPQAVHLTSADRAAFSSYKGSIGERMMAKMGYTEGTGLGLHGEGIVTPVESKMRPKNAGIAFKGFEERTSQSKAEAKRKARRDGKVSDEEEQIFTTRDGTQKKRSDAWKKKSKAKTKFEHKSYEEIIAESGAPNLQLPEKIIDATGAEFREVSSLADIATASWTPSTDPMRIPEVRHNLRLLCESCKTDLNGLAQEAKIVAERNKWVEQEDMKTRKKIADEANLIARLRKVHLVVDDIEKQARSFASTDGASLDLFADLFETLVTQYAPEFERYRLDEIVVAAMAPLVKQIVIRWDPLSDPDILTQQLRRWRTALKFKAPEVEPNDQLDIYGDRFGLTNTPVNQPAAPMTPYESLIWNVWLPKVRSAINNDWQVEEPAQAIRLFETWSDLLPAFIRDNFLDQLVIPKLRHSISEWHPRKSKMQLQTFVFPWLPHLGLRREEVMDEARRKVKHMLRSWRPNDGLPEEILAWKEAFDKGEWESLTLKYIVPKLGATLREEFTINPAEQDIEPFNDVMLWNTHIRASVFSQILETEFFPKWLDILYQWLKQSQASLDEVAEWYTSWKKLFPESVLQMSGIQQGFMYAQQLMNDALDLGSRASADLMRPDYHTLFKKTPVTANGQQATPKSKAAPSRLQEITFKSLVEEQAAKHNLFFVSTGRAHEQSRMPLYRVSTRVDGKGGVEVFILDDAIWMVEGDDYHIIRMDDMILRAIKQ